MAKSNANEKELSYKGCYGSQVKYHELQQFLEDCFHMNRIAEKSGGERFAGCIYGHAGVGKTQIVKQFAKNPVDFQGVRYPGYNISDVPIAQFEEMGDLHGLPEKHVLMKKADDSGPKVVVSEQWVPLDIVDSYRKDAWDIDYTSGVRTMYAPPDWVPSKPGPSILLLDDWNRSSIRIIKGSMQLLQTFGMVSWKLPPGCHIVLTGNPDEQDYLVSTIDSAHLTRIRHITLKHDAPEWAVWATTAKLDPRGINYVLTYPEMMIGKQRTNPRTLAEFFRYSRTIGSIDNPSDKHGRDRFVRMANGLLDEETVTSIMVYFSRDVEMIAEPEKILAGDPWAFSHVKNLMKQKEKRMDVLGVTIDRLYAKIIQPDTEPTPDAVANFQKFICMDEIPDEPRHNICMRIVRTKDGRGKNQKWVMANKKLQAMIMDIV